MGGRPGTKRGLASGFYQRNKALVLPPPSPVLGSPGGVTRDRSLELMVRNISATWDEAFPLMPPNPRSEKQEE